MMAEDEFQLYDLQVTVEAIEGNCTCNMAVGDCFYLKSGKVSMPDGKDFCLWAMQSVIPLLPAKQRRNHPADWMESDSRVVCPDPACKLTMQIERMGLRTLRHDDVSPISWEEVQRTKREAGSEKREAKSGSGQ
jgi:uncharacterized repeat protein (TIGR04076 family)